MDDLYRKNAGIVVFNKDRKVLMFERTNGSRNNLWQFPQGGIEEGETPCGAALRELFEETGIKSVKVVKTLDYGIKYDFPKEVLAKFRAMNINNIGQEQFWTLAYFYGDESEINLQQEERAEFKDCQWMDLEEPVKLAWAPKRESYRIAMREFMPMIMRFEN